MPAEPSERRVLLINPNTDARITRALVSQALGHAGPGTRVTGVTAAFGAPVIATRAGFAVAGHAALDAYARHGPAVDGIVLGCFGDPGLAALRELARVPVAGLADAAFAAAREPFGVLTAGPVWRAMLAEQVALLPQAGLCRGIWALPQTGAAVRADPGSFVDALEGLVDAALAAGARTVLLGGAVLAGFAQHLRPRVRLVDPLQAALAQLDRMIAPGGWPGPGPAVAQPGPAVGLARGLGALLG